MRKKCKVCGAPLDNERCDYCGTNHGEVKQTTAEDIVNSPTATASNEYGFLGSLENSTQNSEQSQNSTKLQNLEQPQPVTMMMEPKKFNPAIIIGIVIALLIAGGLWFFLSRSNLNALELLERSHQAQEEIDSMIMDVDVELGVSMPGMSVDIPMTMRLEMESEDRMRMDMNVSMMGMDMDTTTFLRDGYEYTEEEEFGVVNRSRSAVDTAGAIEAFEMFDTTFVTENMIEDSSASRTNDGYRLELTLDIDSMMPFFENLDMMDDLFDFDDVFGDWHISMIMYIDGDYLPISLELNMEVEVAIEGMDATMVLNMIMTMVQFGDVTIDFPYWLDEMGEVGVDLSGDPIAATDLIGTWEWDIGGHIFVFNADGTGTDQFTDSAIDEFTWEILNGNHIYITYDGHWTDRWAAVIEGNVLTITDLDFPSIVYIYHRSDQIGTPPRDVVSIDDSALLGYWENGSGLIFLWVFEEADSVEFLANGTIIITEDGESNTVNWNPTGAGSFIADNETFTYSINGDILTITDSFNDSWSFERGEGSSSTDSNDGAETSDVDIVGTWEWNNNDDFIYIFNADGTATRGFSNSRVDFEWEMTDGNVINMTFADRTENWEAVIENGVLTISSLDNDDVWSYIRAD